MTKIHYLKLYIPSKAGYSKLCAATTANAKRLLAFLIVNHYFYHHIENIESS